MAGHMQAFYAMKMLRKVIKEKLHIKKLGVLDMISNSVIIKLLSELPDHLEEIEFMSVLH
jgi:hypothetical protein